MIARLLTVLVFLSALIPLALLKGLAHPFITTRELAFRVLMAALLPLWAFAATPRLRPRSAWGWTAVVACAALLPGVLFSVDAATSFWGFAERLTGALTVALVVCYAAVLSGVLRDAKVRGRFLWLWCGVWAFIALWAVGERVIPGFWSAFNGGNTRSVATIGNPIFLANALIIAGALGGSAALTLGRSKAVRWLGAGFVLLCGAAILATQTRGALLGVGAGIAVAAFVFAFLRGGRRMRAAACAIPLLAVAALLGLYLLRDNPSLRAAPVIGRVTDVFRADDPSRVQRLQLWGIAVEAIRQRPLTGWGWENFDTVLDRLYLPNFTRYTISQSYSDRAHNAYLDVAAAGGLLALAAYLAVLGMIGAQILALRRAGTLGNASVAAGIGGLAAYAVANLTAFETLPTLMCLAVSCAVLAALRPSQAAAVPAPGARITAVSVAAIAAVALVVMGVVPLARGAAIVRVATGAAADGDLAALADAARDLGSFENPYRAQQEQRVANDIFKMVGNDSQFSAAHADALAAAKTALEDAVARRPDHFASQFTLANILFLQAIHGIGDLEDARAAFEAARPLAPRRQIVDYQLGNLELVRKDPPAAVAAFARALALDTEVSESHWHYARGLAAAGETARAAEEFRLAWHAGFRGVRPDQEYSVAIGALSDAGDLTTIRDIYAYRAAVTETNSDLYAALAATHAALGELAAAAEALRTAVRLDPTLRAEAAVFIERYGLPADTLTP